MKCYKIAITTAALALSTNVLSATLITFDDAIEGSTTYSFDSNNNGSNDVVFSTTDSSGFNVVGPGPAQAYINEPGLEGSTLLNPDLRVDFLSGATGSMNFSFAVSEFNDFDPSIPPPLDAWGNLKVYDVNDNLLASVSEQAIFTPMDINDPINNPFGAPESIFAEGIINLAFSGEASYALLDFNTSDMGGQRYIIDNFEGTFGAVSSVPIPSAVWLFGSGLLGLVGIARRNK